MGFEKNFLFFLIFSNFIYYAHKGAYSFAEAKNIVISLAGFHKGLWGVVSDKRGSYWALERRNEDETKKHEINWQNFLNNFPSILDQLDKDDI